MTLYIQSPILVIEILIDFNKTKDLKMTLTYSCGHVIEATSEEANDSQYVEYLASLRCEHCRKPEKKGLRDTMSAIANHHEEKGKKWNPIIRTWE